MGAAAGSSYLLILPPRMLHCTDLRDPLSLSARTIFLQLLNFNFVLCSCFLL